MNFNFPRVGFVDENGIVGQVMHMGSEQMEAMISALTPGIEHTAEKIMDTYHSCETALRILEEKYGIDLDGLQKKVELKKETRGYYK